MIATTQLAEKRLRQDLEERALERFSAAERFANRVEQRADEVSGGGMYGRLWLEVLLQLILVATIMIALSYGQLGGIITRGCQVSFFSPRENRGNSANTGCRAGLELDVFLVWFGHRNLVDREYRQCSLRRQLDNAHLQSSINDWHQ